MPPPPTFFPFFLTSNATCASCWVAVAGYPLRGRLLPGHDGVPGRLPVLAAQACVPIRNVAPEWCVRCCLRTCVRESVCVGARVCVDAEIHLNPRLTTPLPTHHTPTRAPAIRLQCTRMARSAFRFCTHRWRSLVTPRICRRSGRRFRQVRWRQARARSACVGMNGKISQACARVAELMDG